MGVAEEKMLYSSEFHVNGELFTIKVFCGAAGYYATTCIGEGDVIITDGPSVPEVLKRHGELLPLAVGAREVTQSYLGAPRRGRPRSG